MLVSLGFQVSSDNPGTDFSSIVPVATGLQIHVATVIAKLTALAALHENITAALAQPVDGNDATEWTVYAGRTNGTDLTVEFTRDPGTDRSLDTITIATIPAWKRVKAEFFLQGLVQYGFVTAP